MTNRFGQVTRTFRTCCRSAAVSNLQCSNIGGFYAIGSTFDVVDVMLSLSLLGPTTTTRWTTRPPTTTSSMCTPTWISRPGVNSQYGNPRRDLTTLVQCQAACVADHRCVGVDWNAWPRPGYAYCWMHSDAANFRRRYATSGVTQHELTSRCGGSTAPPPVTTTSSGRLVLSVHVAASNRALSDRRG